VMRKQASEIGMAVDDHDFDAHAACRPA